METISFQVLSAEFVLFYFLLLFILEFSTHRTKNKTAHCEGNFFFFLKKILTRSKNSTDLSPATPNDQLKLISTGKVYLCACVDGSVDPMFTLLWTKRSYAFIDWNLLFMCECKQTDFAWEATGANSEPIKCVTASAVSQLISLWNGRSSANVVLLTLD